MQFLRSLLYLLRDRLKAAEYRKAVRASALAEEADSVVAYPEQHTCFKFSIVMIQSDSQSHTNSNADYDYLSVQPGFTMKKATDIYSRRGAENRLSYLRHGLVVRLCNNRQQLADQV